MDKLAQIKESINQLSRLCQNLKKEILNRDIKIQRMVSVIHKLNNLVKISDDLAHSVESPSIKTSEAYFLVKAISDKVQEILKDISNINE